MKKLTITLVSVLAFAFVALTASAFDVTTSMGVGAAVSGISIDTVHKQTQPVQTYTAVSTCQACHEDTTAQASVYRKRTSVRFAKINEPVNVDEPYGLKWSIACSVKSRQGSHLIDT